MARKLYTDEMHVKHLNDVFDSNFTEAQLLARFDHLITAKRNKGHLSPEMLLDYITTGTCGELVKKYIPTDFYTTKLDAERIFYRYAKD